jgi:hypothetical protein
MICSTLMPDDVGDPVRRYGHSVVTLQIRRYDQAERDRRAALIVAEVPWMGTDRSRSNLGDALNGICTGIEYAIES